MFGSVSERLDVRNLRGPHIADAISDAHFLDLLRIICQRDALVIDFEFFGRLQLVKRDHFFGAANQNLANLYWRQPGDVHMRDKPGLVE